MLNIKQKAHIMVKAALNKGTLERPYICSQCGYSVEDNKRWAFNFIKAHHDDYTKPLDIRWLCESCHKKWHLSQLINNGKKPNKVG